MDPLFVTVPVEKITDWPSFHDVFQETLGFPKFYGRNMNAWIDCMTSIDTPEDGLSGAELPQPPSSQRPALWGKMPGGGMQVRAKRLSPIGRVPALADLAQGLAVMLEHAPGE